jgi:predicted AlkP superfamily phosphohydrolase/phosphomutase
MNRRAFMKGLIGLGLGTLSIPTRPSFGRKMSENKKVLVLGVDGMDPRLTQRYMSQGWLPNLTKLARKGGMTSVSTSFPPQSPVAWSTFITGAESNVHGIYDFIHRDPQTLAPYFSTSKVIPPAKILNIGDWNIPISRGRTESLRKGTPFWKYLADHDIPTTLFKMPTNFPSSDIKGVRMVSGLGTPDLRGSYGNYTVFTTAPEKFKRDVSGGRILQVRFDGEMLKAELPGPENSLREGHPESLIRFKIWRDFRNSVVRVAIQEREFILGEGEWTGWIPLSFHMMSPFYNVSGIIKIYLKSVHPEFAMYVSPININPADPALPVVSTKEYGEELVRNVGYFYTQGFPADTKALSEGILDEREYLDLSHQIIRERISLLEFELKRFIRRGNGLLFFYFSNLDQDSHMYYRFLDQKHPLYDPDLARDFGDTIRNLYVNLDDVIGKVVDQYDINDPKNSLMVMSDHGFASFRRQVNLNNWLYENEFLALNDNREIENHDYFGNVDWQKTKAYNVGINSIYLNISGRETKGSVSPDQSESLCAAIRRKLMQLVDPQSGEKAVSRVWAVPSQEKTKNPYAPDLIVGWNFGYRTSWNSILGGMSKEIFSDNLDRWSGDHCVDPALVPAVLISNRKIVQESPALYDLTASVLREFHIPQTRTGQMIGKGIFDI